MRIQVKDIVDYIQSIGNYNEDVITDAINYVYDRLNLYKTDFMEWKRFVDYNGNTVEPYQKASLDDLINYVNRLSRYKLENFSLDKYPLLLLKIAMLIASQKVVDLVGEEYYKFESLISELYIEVNLNVVNDIGELQLQNFDKYDIQKSISFNYFYQSQKPVTVNCKLNWNLLNDFKNVNHTRSIDMLFDITSISDYSKLLYLDLDVECIDYTGNVLSVYNELSDYISVSKDIRTIEETVSSNLETDLDGQTSNYNPTI
ncbi:MAG: hypothetical protein HPY57_13180 [Ignavibacteria bacterium]|nr:hypothetical protein [Ignavibacteria bacterium]